MTAITDSADAVFPECWFRVASDDIEMERANCKQRDVQYHLLPCYRWQIMSPGKWHRFSAPLFTYVYTLRQ
jgi:hypothetical protein